MPKKSVGRPTKHRDEFNEQAYKLCLMGATDDELAAFFEVNQDTINEWKKQIPEFSESVKKGKVKADAEVANSFHKRAIGYSYEEIHYEKIVFEDNMFEEAIGQDVYRKRVIVKEIVPDAGAALNWLKNRQPDKWRDVSNIELSGSVKSYKIVPASNRRTGNSGE